MWLGKREKGRQMGGKIRRGGIGNFSIWHGSNVKRSCQLHFTQKDGTELNIKVVPSQSCLAESVSRPCTYDDYALISTRWSSVS